MPTINWTISREEFDLLLKVVDRALREIRDYPDEPRTLIMDLNAAHCNGCPIDFAGLLEADDFEFAHDIVGIRKHIDRSTGQVLGFFTPRYALANHIPKP
jgi:hypothetical protein